MRVFLPAFIFLWTLLPLLGQQRTGWPLRWDSDTDLGHLDLPTQAPDSLQSLQRIQQALLQLQAQGHLEANADTLICQAGTCRVYLHLGPRYQWQVLKPGNVPAAWLRDAKIRLPKATESKNPVNPTQVNQWLQALLDEAGNKGYPLAYLRIDSLRHTPSGIQASLYMDPGPLITMSPILVEGKAPVATTFLERFLGIYPGAIYQAKTLSRVSTRLRELPWLQMTAEPLVRFKGNKAELVLQLQPRPASRWDAIIGILPNNSGPVNKLRLTAALTGELYNPLKRGERAYFDLQLLTPGTQQLELRVQYPYPFQLPFGVDAQAQWFRRDTTFQEVRFEYGIDYVFDRGDRLRLFGENSSNSLISVNASALLNARKLPAQLDLSRQQAGLEYQVRRLDYRFNPRKGWSIDAKAGLGLRKIRVNPAIQSLRNSNIDFTTAYDSLDLQQVQGRVDLAADYFIPIARRSTFRSGIRSGSILSDQRIYTNEQYRIGGNRLLRGFDEATVPATWYVMGTLEYRLLIGLNSYFLVFTDYAYINNTTAAREQTFTALGMGGGLVFETKAGLFGVTLALGRQQSNPLDPRQIKTHFGYISRF